MEAKAEVPKVSASQPTREGSNELGTFIRRNGTRKRLRLQGETTFKRTVKNTKVKLKAEKEKEETESKVYFTFFRGDQDAKAAGYLYRRIWVADVPMLMEGKGLAMVQSLGLEEFLRNPIPNLNKPLCDEFISTYSSAASCGTVGGREVRLDVDSVIHATKLPSGPEKVPSSGNRAELRKLLSGSDTHLKTSRGFNLGHLVERDDKECFQAVAGMLMMKLEARKECFQFVSGEVLVALDRSLRAGLQIDWAEYLTRLMLKATAHTSKKVPSSSIGYQYGEWLTRIIENSMDKEEQLAVLETEGDHGLHNGGEESQAPGEMQLVTEPQTGNWMVPFEGREEYMRVMEIQEENLRLQQQLEEAGLCILELERKRDEGVGIIRDALSWLKKDIH